ncbi:hypothetical protein EKO04_000812 [Ascochyta lentis]|uniref:Uncharacterized protein n=1 Tax=Ascochyta lentis TaxID=205686 RepID=A0A8H7MMQ6_9PLEO|nr:hypothetical protein EKO04_000812 [Ascochyta lentis]
MHRKAPISLLSFSLFLNPIFAASRDTSVSNANHIFNAIHSSMRQWGGSLNHNGMSFFLATVPAGTQLYHGTSDPDFIQGLQWLAFEPEHALIFARPRGGPGGPPPGEGERPPDGNGPAAKDMPHDGEGWKHHGPPPDREHGPPPPPPHHDDKDCEHHRPPPDHKQRPRPSPCNDTERCPPPHHDGHGSPPPPDCEHGPRKGGSHCEHGPPPPLPPGHIYKPYPPPPRKDRPYKGPSHPPNPEHHRGPAPDHDEWPPKHRGPPSPVREDHHGYHESIEMRSSLKGPWKRQAQQPLKEPISSPDKEPVGYLHTYVPKHPLRLLYVDGLSAGKTSNGTLDTQDRLLLNLTEEDIGGPMGGESMRANGLCELAATVWEDKVDGILRLEGGFEIILCDFEKHLERTDVVAVIAEDDRGRGPMGGWQYMKAITSRYHGIGGNRVHVDYDKFVSVFAHEDIKGLWDNDVQSDHRMPRLTNVSPSTLHKIKDDVTALILSKDWQDETGTDWQATADMIVSRYSRPLHHITTQQSFRNDKDELATHLTSLLRPFIDPTARNASLETARCTAQILPPLPSLSIPRPP